MRDIALPETIESVIDQLSKEQLMELNRRVVDRVKAMQEMEILLVKSKLFVGDRVKFSFEGDEYVGKIIKKNKKTIEVCTGNHRHWKVSPRLLTKIHQAGGS